MMSRLLFILAALFLCLIQSVLPVAAAMPAKYQKSVERYKLPDVTLYNQDGKKVRLLDYLNSGKPVIADFIFGTCTTICPVLSAGYVNLQRKIGDGSKKIQMVSFSIDPENDSPKVMKEYLKRYKAKDGWDFLTGSRKDIDAVMHAFNSYIPNKMSHYAVTFIYQPQTGTWIKLYGILSSTDFMSEVQKAGLLQ